MKPLSDVSSRIMNPPPTAAGASLRPFSAQNSRRAPVIACVAVGEGMRSQTSRSACLVLIVGEGAKSKRNSFTAFCVSLPVTCAAKEGICVAVGEGMRSKASRWACFVMIVGDTAALAFAKNSGTCIGASLATDSAVDEDEADGVDAPVP